MQPSSPPRPWSARNATSIFAIAKQHRRQRLARSERDPHDVVTARLERSGDALAGAQRDVALPAHPAHQTPTRRFSIPHSLADRTPVPECILRPIGHAIARRRSCLRRTVSVSPHVSRSRPRGNTSARHSAAATQLTPRTGAAALQSISTRIAVMLSLPPRSFARSMNFLHRRFAAERSRSARCPPRGGSRGGRRCRAGSGRPASSCDEAACRPGRSRGCRRRG